MDVFSGGDEDIYLYNDLFTECSWAVNVYPYSDIDPSYYDLLQSRVHAQNVTVDHSDLFLQFYPANMLVSLEARNCILSNVGQTTSDGANIGGSNNGFYNSPTFGSSQTIVTASPFQTIGVGHYYLATKPGGGDASGFRGKGTTNGIDPALLVDLKNRSTSPPVALPPFMTVSGDLRLFPQVPRYVNGAPDLGYYYDALDYTIAAMWIESGSVSVEPGTAIAVRMDYIPSIDDYTYFGFDLSQDSSFTSQSAPMKPNIFTDVQLVQEGSAWPIADIFQPDFLPAEGETANPPSLNFRFSNFFMRGGSWLNGPNFHFLSGISMGAWFEPTMNSAVFLDVRDCSFHGGQIDFCKDDIGEGPASISWVNNFFDRVGISIDPDWPDYGNPTVYVDMAFRAYNNLFFGGPWFHLEPVAATAGNWALKDNLFDKVHFYQDANQPLDYDYNAYWPLQGSEINGDGDAPQISITVPADDLNGGHEVLLDAAPPYQTGPLGDFYLALNSPLYSAPNRGSRSVADAGLYHYTTRVDQVKDGAQSGNVIIGHHYVATASSTSTTPLDTDGDAIPDYVEDGNGNGAVDAGTETDWQHNYSTTDPTTGQAVADAYSTIYDDVDLSGDGLVGRIKKALGVSPLDTSNPLTLTRTITGREPQFATFEVPVNYSTMTSAGHLELLMDGSRAEFQECDQASDGNCLLKWNAAYEPGGKHFISVEFTLNRALGQGDTPDPTVVNGAGPMDVFNSGVVCHLNPAYSTYDSSGATLYAKLPEAGASYTFQLNTPSGTPIRTISGSTSSDEINVNWDLTDAGGSRYSGSSVNATLSLTPTDPGLSPGSVTFWLTQAFSSDGDFTVAYGWQNIAQAEKGGALFNCIMGSVIDELMEPCNDSFCWNHPYSSQFNAWDTYPYGTGNPGYLTQQADVYNLLSNLGNQGFGPTENFFFSGHGNRVLLSGTPWVTDFEIDVEDVHDALQNYGGIQGPRWHHPYRLVYLDACETADFDNWAHAFGIPDRITSAQLVQESNPHPQAFVGWAGSPRAPVTDDEWNQEAATYAVLWGAWMSAQYTLQDCLHRASQEYPNYPDLTVHLTFPLGVKFSVFAPFSNGFHPRIYGYAGIMREGFDPSSSYDDSPYYR